MRVNWVFDSSYCKQESMIENRQVSWIFLYLGILERLLVLRRNESVELTQVSKYQQWMPWVGSLVQGYCRLLENENDIGFTQQFKWLPILWSVLRIIDRYRYIIFQVFTFCFQTKRVRKTRRWAFKYFSEIRRNMVDLKTTLYALEPFIVSLPPSASQFPFFLCARFTLRWTLK